MAQDTQTVDEAQRALFATVSEADLLTEVVRLARIFSWRAYHTHSSLKSAAGFPDLVLVRAGPGTDPGRVLFAELKREGGRLTRRQLRHDRRGRPRLLEGQVESPSDAMRGVSLSLHDHATPSEQGNRGG